MLSSMNLLLSVFVLTIVPCSSFPDVDNAQYIPRYDGSLNIYALPVGQGDCTVIQCPQGNMLIVDMGRRGGKVLNGANRMDASTMQDILFSDSGVQKISVVITHADEDHLNLLKSTLENHLNQVDVVLYGGKLEDYKSRSAKAFIADGSISWKVYSAHKPDGATCFHPQCANAEKISYQNVCQDTQNPIRFDIAAANIGKSKNARSVILKIWTEGVGNNPGWSIVLPGDFTNDGKTTKNEDDLWKNAGDFIKTPTLYKLAHHGACTNTNNRQFLKRLDAGWFFFSSAKPKENSFGHPSCRVFDRISGYAKDDNTQWNMKKLPRAEAPYMECSNGKRNPMYWTRDSPMNHLPVIFGTFDAEKYVAVRFKFNPDGSPMGNMPFGVSNLNIPGGDLTPSTGGFAETTSGYCATECEKNEDCGSDQYCIRGSSSLTGNELSTCEDCMDCDGAQRCILHCGCRAHSDCRDVSTYCGVQNADAVSGTCEPCNGGILQPIDGDRSVCEMLDAYKRCPKLFSSVGTYHLDYQNGLSLISRKFVYKRNSCNTNKDTCYVYYSFVLEKWLMSNLRGGGSYMYSLNSQGVTPESRNGLLWESRDGAGTLDLQCEESRMGGAPCENSPGACSPGEFCDADGDCLPVEECLMDQFALNGRCPQRSNKRATTADEDNLPRQMKRMCLRGRDVIVTTTQAQRGLIEGRMTTGPCKRQ